MNSKNDYRHNYFSIIGTVVKTPTGTFAKVKSTIKDKNGKTFAVCFGFRPFAID